MSTRGSTFWDDSAPMDWVAEKRDCPFCTINRRICGCPHAEHIENMRAQHYDSMGTE